MLGFSIEHKSDNARVCTIQTPHGLIKTPAFLFCATKAAIRGVAVWDIEAQILLSNTYHLMVQPGVECIQRLGGLHAFMSWNGPIFTDSGGYQIFSLGHGSVGQEIKGKGQKAYTRKLAKVTEGGAIFSSYTNGQIYTLTPERAIEVQNMLGSDLMCVLDECTPFHVSPQYTEKSMYLSHRWGVRSLKAFQKVDVGNQGLYGIMQGGVYEHLRRESGAFISAQPFFGHAIGGSLGDTKEHMYEVISMARRALSGTRPIHLLGIGGLSDILHGVSEGIDTFDCVSPTRLGRHGCALITKNYWKDAQEPFRRTEHIDLSKSCFRNDPRPIDETCPCKTCQTYTRSYLHHLMKAKELLALSALTIHNMIFMNRFMQAIRQHIVTNTLKEIRNVWIAHS